MECSLLDLTAMLFIGFAFGYWLGQELGYGIRIKMVRMR